MKAINRFLRPGLSPQPKHMRHRQLCAPLALALLSAVGCGEKWAEVFPASGVVKVDGQAPVGAKLVLHAVTPQGPDAAAPTASVKLDGSFAVTTYQAGDGAPAGDYIVTIQWYKIDKDGTVGPNVIPAQYGNPKTSPIKVTVNASGPTQLEPIAIAAAKTAGRPALAARR
jgi:hypothetical protein